ncbi:MAG: response regulator [bacterium]|nr:MAG: response regulator [bacterium]
MASGETNESIELRGGAKGNGNDSIGSLEVIRAFLQNDIIGIAYLDSEGIYRVFNRAAETLTGYSSDEILGGPIPERLFPKEIQARIRRGMAENASLDSVETHLFCKDGTEREIILGMSSRLLVDGKPHGHVQFLIDNSEKKHLQRLLLHSQRMEIVSEMAGGIAHDFNNLLEGILGYTSFMMNLIDESHELRSYLEIIERSAKKAANLTDRLLTFSGGKSGEEATVNCNGLLSEVAKLIDRTIDKRIVIELNLDRNLQPVKGSSGQLEQAFLNVCLNARDAMPTGGKLLVSSENVVIDETCPRMSWKMKSGNYVKLSITDTGVGMDEETKGRIFEPFFTTKERDEGTGLGLNVVYGIIDRHGGFVNVYSEKEKGTVVNIYLPAQMAEVEPVAHEEAKAEIPRGEQERVLIIDDEQIVRDLARKMLIRLGYRTLTAADAREGEQIFRRNKDEVDLILLDIIMPGASGWDLMRTIRDIKPGVKVLLTSGYNKAAIDEGLFEDERVGFIQKPYSIGDLAREVRAILDKRVSS